MKGVVLETINGSLKVEELQVPELDVGQVLVDVQAAAICGAQVDEVSGMKGPDPYLPHLLGHEGAGIVVDVGPGVHTVNVGDRVVMHWRKGSGIEARPPKYVGKGRMVGAGPVATFVEQAVVSENRVTSIEDQRIPFSVAALLGCAVTTGLGIINNEARVRFGESVLVIGCGGVGLNVVQGARMASAYPIIAIDLQDEKLRLANKLGATNCFTDLKSACKSDVVVVCVGIPEVVAAAFKKVKPGGRLILVGQTPHGASLEIPNFRRVYDGITVMDSRGGGTDPDRDIPRYAELYMNGLLDLDSLITDIFRIDDVNQAFDVVRSGKAGRVQLVMGGN